MRRAIVAIAIVAGLISLGSVLANEALHPLLRHRDIAIDHVADRALLRGENPYGPFEPLARRDLPGYNFETFYIEGLPHLTLPNWHTPVRLLIHLPLALLPYRAAIVVWSVIEAACLVGALWIFARSAGWSPSIAAVLGFGALILPIVRLDIDDGQVHGLLLLLLVLAWRDLRSRREQRAGAWLGTAIAIKLFPGFLLLPLIGARRWRAAGVAVTSGLALLLVGWLATGAHSEFLPRVADVRVWRVFSDNVSWQGMSERLFPNSAAAYLGSAFLCLLALHPRSAASKDPFWTAVLLMLIAWPIVWSQYLLLLIPWFCLSLTRTRGMMRILVAAVLAAIAVSPVSFTTNRLALFCVPLALLVAVAVETSPVNTPTVQLETDRVR